MQELGCTSVALMYYSLYKNDKSSWQRIPTYQVNPVFIKTAKRPPEKNVHTEENKETTEAKRMKQYSKFPLF